MSFNDVAFIYIKGSADRIHFWLVYEQRWSISIMSNSNLVDKKGVF